MTPEEQQQHNDRAAYLNEIIRFLLMQPPVVATNGDDKFVITLTRPYDKAIPEEIHSTAHAIAALIQREIDAQVIALVKPTDVMQARWYCAAPISDPAQQRVIVRAICVREKVIVAPDHTPLVTIH